MMARKSRIDHAQLKALVSYDPLTGRFTRLTASGGFEVGTTTGCLRKNGRVYVGLKGVYYFAHRLAWFYVHGRWPAEEIDHINGDPADNRLENLREASRIVNAQNQRVPKRTSRTGVMGVTAEGNRFYSSIHAGGRRVHLGTFKTLEEARQAYLSAKREHHVGCTI